MVVLCSGIPAIFSRVGETRLPRRCGGVVRSRMEDSSGFHNLYCCAALRPGCSHCLFHLCEHLQDLPAAYPRDQRAPCALQTPTAAGPGVNCGICGQGQQCSRARAVPPLVPTTKIPTPVSAAHINIPRQAICYGTVPHHKRVLYPLAALHPLLSVGERWGLPPPCSLIPNHMAGHQQQLL